MAQGIYSRFSPAELAKLQAKAEEAGMTQSAFVRASALQALKQESLEKTIALAVQAEARALCDDFLNHYYEAQENTAKAFNSMLAKVASDTKQAIAPKPVDQSAEVIRQIEERARMQGRPLSTAEAVHIQRLKNNIVPNGAPD